MKRIVLSLALLVSAYSQVQAFNFGILTKKQVQAAEEKLAQSPSVLVWLLGKKYVQETLVAANAATPLVQADLSDCSCGITHTGETVVNGQASTIVDAARASGASVKELSSGTVIVHTDAKANLWASARQQISKLYLETKQLAKQEYAAFKKEPLAQAISNGLTQAQKACMSCYASAREAVVTAQKELPIFVADNKRTLVTIALVATIGGYAAYRYATAKKPATN